MDKGAQLAQTIGVVALRNENHLRVVTQAGQCLVVQTHIGDEKELDGSVAG